MGLVFFTINTLIGVIGIITVFYGAPSQPAGAVCRSQRERHGEVKIGPTTEAMTRGTSLDPESAVLAQAR